LVNAVYYFNGRVYGGATPASMNIDCISHVFYAFLAVASSGQLSVSPVPEAGTKTEPLQLSDKWADTEMDVDGCRGCIGSLQRLKQERPHLKLLFSVGGGNASGNFAQIAANPASRDVFGRSAQQIVVEYGFDGLDSMSVHVWPLRLDFDL
jgi:chitinase